MMESSNIGTAQIAGQIGADPQQASSSKAWASWARSSRTCLSAARTLTIPKANWDLFATMTVGFGHGIAVTPLHLALGYATLYNGGIYRPATLLKVGRAIRSPRAGGCSARNQLQDARLAPPRRHQRHRQEGERHRLPRRGKTGTAEKIIGGRYSKAAVVTTSPACSRWTSRAMRWW